MSLAIKLSEQFSSSCLTSGIGLFGGIEASKVFMLFLVLDVRDVVSRLLVKGDTFKSACISTPITMSEALVHDVLRTRSQSQIGPTIIGAIAVTVINLFWWPFIAHNEPNQAVGIIIAVVNPKADVSVQSPSRWLANYRSTRERLLPRQNPRVGVVIEDATDELRSEVVAGAFVSHLGSLADV